MDEIRYQLKHFRVEFSPTYVIIGVNLVLFILVSFVQLALAGNVYYWAGGNAFPLLVDGQIWRLLTSVFLHGNILHLGLNMLFLYQVGRMVEKFYGNHKFTLIYLATGLAASLFSALGQGLWVLINPNANFSLSIGASGAIFGLLGLLLGNTIFRQRFGIALPVERNSLLIIVGVNFLFGLTIPGVDNLAHFGGLVVGMILSLLVKPEVWGYKQENSEKVIKILTVLGIMLVALAFILQLIWILANI